MAERCLRNIDWLGSALLRQHAALLEGGPTAVSSLTADVATQAAGNVSSCCIRPVSCWFHRLQQYRQLLHEHVACSPPIHSSCALGQELSPPVGLRLLQHAPLQLLPLLRRERPARVALKVQWLPRLSRR